MTLHEINELKALTYDELVRRARGYGIDAANFATRDSLRLAIIDRIIGRELGER